MKYSRRWARLDNAANIFPSATSSRDTKVFRFACELRDEVDPQILSRALDRTIQQFPLFLSVLKRGLFWYYFEETARRPAVEQEHEPPCAPIYSGDRKNLLFKVTYYKRRINFEVFHALTDGTGALQFLRTLVCYYIGERYAGELDGRLPAIDYDASESQKSTDSFSRYYSGKPQGSFTSGCKAYKLRGDVFFERRLSVIEGLLSAPAVLAEAKKRGATLTEFLAAVLICAIRDTMSVQDQQRPVVVTVPVNLRRFFPSETARNFFSVVNVSYRFGQGDDSLEAVLASVRQTFQSELTTERLRCRLDKLGALERHFAAKMAPLVFKDVVLRIASAKDSRGVTAALSNLGVVQMPPEAAPYVRMFDVLVSTEKMQTCLCTFGSCLAVSFTSPFLGTDVQRRFFRTLTELGLEVEISANQADTTEQENAYAVL